MVVAAGAFMALAGRDGTPTTSTAAGAVEHSVLPKAAKTKSFTFTEGKLDAKACV